MKKAAFHNLGCKVNTYELDVMEQILKNRGYEIVPFEEAADVYVINTCSVTNIADRKSRQMIHRAKKNNPEAVVVAVGCYVQTAGEDALADECADLCIGNNKKGEIGELLEKFLADRENENYAVPDISAEKEYEELFLTETADHVRAYIKIQDGCNQFCSYCIIPHARGRVRSRRAENIIKEIRELAEKGYREFVLTGIHISSYGTDFVYRETKANLFHEESLLCLIEKIAEIPGVDRIRLGSLEPRIISEEFAERLSKIRKLCPHFHLSLQSGCDETLKRMNRKYTTEEFLEKVELLRKSFVHPAITTDVICGFPGEDEAEFEQTKAFLEKVRFFEMHIFKYSKRKNTPAAVMPGQLTEAEKGIRSDELLEMEMRHSNEFRSFYLGKDVPVLMEEKKRINGEEYFVGHTPEYVKVAVRGEEDWQNRIVNVRCEKLLGKDYVLGTKV
ncbi:MAG: tRNA (N(6)-L-threonylcarbamoyladenosine(37)-C(2))-methylthiotransferase MtaB [Lachnospiraceae bacterium]|nr:tRNA (N(6)-L-threonylcarbamoyladenosine(37)-C(2))-methylthiotransferase MtaB [Lachnospiraceae bacterium]MBQ8260704.1 tRNA (N(6)-L-threonylcarbamoyladenosine(37)-C(2))-methylthiotransferase MtaB [Lachnospiraceae bacterium]